VQRVDGNNRSCGGNRHANFIVVEGKPKKVTVTGAYTVNQTLSLLFYFPNKLNIYCTMTLPIIPAIIPIKNVIEK